MFKYNQIVVKNRFLFLRFLKNDAYFSFAQNNFNRCPQYSRNIFGPIKDISEKKSKIKDHFMVKYNQLIVKNRFLFLRFDKNDTDW